MPLSSRAPFAFNVVALALLAAAPGKAKAQIANTIDLSSSRDSLRADGYSRAVVTAVVRDGGGHLVPDGTEVRFATTLGAIDPVAMTEAGRARVNLTSAAVALSSTATLTATSGQAFRSFSILFLPPGQNGPERPSVIPIEGEYVAYSADHATLEAIGRVRVRLGKVTILADHIQLNVATTRLIAESAVDSPGMTVTDGKTTWIARHLSYDWPVSQGVVELQRETFSFVGPPLIKGEKIAKPNPALFQMADLEDTAMWITAKRAALFPGQRINFKKAQIRPGGKKILTLPYHSLPLSLYGPDAEQFIGLGTQGVTIDLPYYLNADSRSATSLRFRWNEIAGSYGAVKPGFGLDLRHRSFIGEHGEETINLTRFTSPDWGAWYQHLRNWTPNFQTSAYVDYPDHRDFFATGNAFWQGKNLTGSLSASSSKPAGVGAAYLSDVSLETRPVALARTGWRYSFISATGITTGNAPRDFRQSLQVRGTLPSWRWNRQTLSSITITGGQILAGQRTGPTADAVWSVNHQFGRRTTLGANYSYFERPGLSQFTSKHRVGVQFVTSGKKLVFSTTGAHTLDGRTTSMINELTYQITPRLMLGLRNTYFDYLRIPYSDQEISLTHPLLNRPFTIYWSRKRHRFMLELAQVSF